MLQDLMHVAVRPVQRFNAMADPGVNATGRTEETVVQFTVGLEATLEELCNSSTQIGPESGNQIQGTYAAPAGWSHLLQALVRHKGCGSWDKKGSRQGAQQPNTH